MSTHPHGCRCSTACRELDDWTRRLERERTARRRLERDEREAEAQPLNRRERRAAERARRAR